MFKQAIVTLISLLSLLAIPAIAVQFPDGRSSFEKAPRLVNMVTTQNSVSVWSAKYYVTIDLPSDIGEPLQQVTIQQRQGFEDINYWLNDTFAFEGQPRNKGERIVIKSATLDQQQNLITVIFDQPVSPGKLITIGLVPRRNPDFDGIYLFGITAYPMGEKPMGLYLGVGRLTFYRDSFFH